MNDLFKAAASGIVEGLTEFIPVSSTGHLILFGSLIEMTGEKAKVFEVFIQLGAIMAAAFLYRDRFKKLFKMKSKEPLSGLDGMIKLAAACFPAAILGFLFHKIIKDVLFAPSVVAVSLIVGGIVMLLVEKRGGHEGEAELVDVSLKQSLFIGVVQALSLCPGVSRSGASIIGGMLAGLSRRAAAEFSFLAAVPLLALAAFYDLLKNLSLFSAADLPGLAVGLLTSFAVGALAIKFLISALSRVGLTPFAWYRIALGAAVLGILG